MRRENHRNRRKVNRIISFAAVAVVVLLIILYIKFFNGSIVYISTGYGKDVLFRVDNNTAYGMEARVLLADYRAEYEKVFGEDIWNQKVGDVSFSEYAKEQVKEKLIRVHTMNLMAKEKGVVLSRAQSEALENAVDEYMAALSEEQIKNMKVSKAKLKEMYTEFAIAKTLYEDMTSNLKFEISADEARVISIQYICAASRNDIEAAKARIDEGETFYMVAALYNGDNYECQLKRGEMEQTFEDVAFELKTGETSDIVEAGGKYYIIKCTSDNDNNKTEANKLNLIEQYKLDSFNSEFEKYEAGKYIDINKKEWEKLSVESAQKLSVNFEEIFNKYLKQE